MFIAKVWLLVGHLICTLIYENQGFEKLRSISNLRKISGAADLIFFFSSPEFFFSLSPEFFSDLWYKSEKNLVDKLKKNSGLLKKKIRYVGPEFLLRFETDLNFSRPWFSEMKVQIKWLKVTSWINGKWRVDRVPSDEIQQSKSKRKVNNRPDKFVWLWYIFWKPIVPWRSLEENIWWSSKYKQKYFWNQSLPDVPNLPFGRWCGPVTKRWTSFWRSIGTFVHIHVYPLGLRNGHAFGLRQHSEHSFFVHP